MSASEESALLPLSFGGDWPVLVVAELSANHGGSLAHAIETVEAAAESGADAIKLQTYRPDTLTIRSTRKEFRLESGPWKGRTLYDLYEEAHTPWEWHPELKKAAQRVGLPLFSTPFDRTAVDFLEELQVPAFKIASFEVGDLGLVAYVAQQRKPIIMSTGMASLGEIDRAVREVRRVWQGRDFGLSLLKCVSAYPASPHSMNLATIPHLASAFQVTAGLSDHTLGTAVATTAVALGAKVIEKHVTMRRSDGGPDSGFSLEPQELRELVAAVREAEAAIGTVHYGPTEEDTASLLYRRSLFIVRDVKAGDPVTRENVRAIRPGHGLAPEAFPWLLGRLFSCDCSAGTPLQSDLLKGG